jgi:hypothetical protein
MQTFFHIQPQINSSHPISKSGIGDGFIILFLLALPIVLAGSELLCRRHQVVKRQQQIETLERMWKLNYQKKTT